MKTNKNGVKLLAAIMALAMVFVAGFTIIGDSTETDAATSDDPLVISSNIMALEGDLIIVDKAVLGDDLTIPDVKNVIIRNGGSLDLKGSDLTVEGTIVIEAGGIINDSEGTGSIILTRNGTIDNSGIIGSGEDGVTVTAEVDENLTYTGDGSITMANVSGITLGVVATGEKDGDEKPIYALTVSGEATYNVIDTGDAEVTISGARIVGEFTIGLDVSVTTGKSTLEKDVYVMPKAVLTIDGILAETSNTLVMKNNSTIIVNGKAADVIVAETGTFEAANPSIGSSSVDLYNSSDEGIKGYVTGIILTVGQISYMDDNTKCIDQRLSIYGTADLVKKEEGDTDVIGKITIGNSTGSGITVVPAGQKLVLDDGVAFDGDGTKPTIILGQIQYPHKTSGPSIENYVGAQYVVADADDSTKKTGYIMPFADAIKSIAIAENKTINNYGDVEIDEGFVLADKQKIISEGSITINDKATVELLKGSSISGTIEYVYGVLKVNTGATTTFLEPTAYEVYKKTTEYVQYSGLGIALKGAISGDEITINDGSVASPKGDLAIPDGVTLIVKGTVNVEKNLTIAENAVLDIQGGTVSMTDDDKAYKIDVKGTLDASEGTLTVTDDGDKIYSTGSIIIASGAAIDDILANADVNAFSYINEPGDIVLTTLANAVLKASAQDIHNDEITAYGKVTETGDITLENMTLYIGNDAEITLGNVELIEAAIVVSEVATLADGDPESDTVEAGKYTATVSGLNGIGDAAEEGTVKVSGYTGSIYQEKGMEITGEDLYTFGIDAISEKVTVTDGTVTLVATSVAENSVLTINEGATLVTSSAVEFSEGTAKLVINGTFKVVGNDVAISAIADNKLTIAGTLEIAEGKVTVSVTTVSITGSVVCSTEEGKEGEFVIDGSRVTVGKKITSIGATASIAGAVKFTDEGDYLVAYAGADLSNAVFNETAGESTHVTTKFLVNGVDYATAYARDVNEVALTTALPLSDVSIDGYTTGTKWVDAAGKDAGSKYVGAIDSVDNNLSPKPANIIYSVGSGISLWVDGVKVDSSTNAVSIYLGTHDVVAKVNPGFKGDITITFNGQKVTDGKITITADMTKTGAAAVVLSATGDITIDAGSTEPVEKDDSGMGITDYLLIVLVVLAAVLVVIVAIRMMRS